MAWGFAWFERFGRKRPLTPALSPRRGSAIGVVGWRKVFGRGGCVWAIVRSIGSCALNPCWLFRHEACARGPLRTAGPCIFPSRLFLFNPIESFPGTGFEDVG